MGAFNDAAAAGAQVKQAQENYNAASKRAEQEREIIESATLNLERARVEKDQADFAVEQYLKEGADILPYAAAPESTGVEYDEESGSYRIQGWNEFVDDAYGPSIKPLYVGSLSNLYSFKLQQPQ